MASIEVFRKALRETRNDVYVHVTDLFRCPDHRVGHWGGRVRVSKRHLLAVVEECASRYGLDDVNFSHDEVDGEVCLVVGR